MVMRKILFVSFLAMFCLFPVLPFLEQSFLMQGELRIKERVGGTPRPSMLIGPSGH